MIKIKSKQSRLTKFKSLITTILKKERYAICNTISNIKLLTNNNLNYIFKFVTLALILKNNSMKIISIKEKLRSNIQDFKFLFILFLGFIFVNYFVNSYFRIVKLSTEQINQIKENQINENQVKENQIKENQINENRVNENQVNENQVNENQINENRVNENQVNENQIKENQINENKIKENQIKENQINENQINENHFKIKRIRPFFLDSFKIHRKINNDPNYRKKISEKYKFFICDVPEIENNDSTIYESAVPYNFQKKYNFQKEYFNKYFQKGYFNNYFQKENFNNYFKDRSNSNDKTRKNKYFFVLTDIVNSTGLWVNNFHAMQKSIFMHNKLVISLCKSFNGYISKYEGDSFLLVFSNLKNAIQFSLELQYRLMFVNWNEYILKNNVYYKKKEKIFMRGLQVRISITHGCALKMKFQNNYSFLGDPIDELYSINKKTSGGETTISEDIFNTDEFKEIRNEFYFARKNCFSDKFFKKGLLVIIHPELLDRYVFMEAILKN
ncbi:putative serine/threonine-protein kinase/receptor [Dictyocoela muelleri]|nr:putative serine/threonine-protein kinase/receptor [Dictyocoela muelleri]